MGFFGTSPAARGDSGDGRPSLEDLARSLHDVTASEGAEDGSEAFFPDDPGAEPDSSNAGESYWSLSRTPLTSLVFALPLVLAYEGGVLLLGRGTPRNGADVWLRQSLDALGFGSYFLLPVLTVVGLLAWHHIEHDRWRFSVVVLAGMAVECMAWAGALIGVARLQDRFWPLAAGVDGEGVFARLVAFCGAGLYEEVLFRLLLLPAIAWACERIGLSATAAAAWGLIGSSLLFSLAHYVGPLGDTFALYSFTFRFLAGLFFAVLFTVRGFGIAAGTHAIYDILVGLL
ncbi:MAG: CPBP family intramembrane metalloprotease [Planctomycetia bacterium]|nr:CPBP family intramembrane metalloprotease [Planctomycetia bacterium]